MGSKKHTDFDIIYSVLNETLVGYRHIQHVEELNKYVIKQAEKIERLVKANA